MTNLSKKLEKLIRQHREILPIKTEQGILVADVLIVSKGSIKDIWHNNELTFEGIYLNAVAIRLANLVARRQAGTFADKIYQADQLYGRWFDDSQHLRNQYQKALNTQDYDRSDILWARYCESRQRTQQAKITAERLATT
jgi:hypothetical protein